jgi:hypothetical protein
VVSKKRRQHPFCKHATDGTGLQFVGWADDAPRAKIVPKNLSVLPDLKIHLRNILYLILHPGTLKRLEKVSKVNTILRNLSTLQFLHNKAGRNGEKYAEGNWSKHARANHETTPVS